MTGWPVTRLGNVASIERNAIQPSAIVEGTAYLGLEHIESGGKILGAKPVGEGELASSKFKFTERHVLYGKLRPYLAKITCPDFHGICSTDILPILPGPDLDRRFLCYFLRQPAMVGHANARAAGANLPRLNPTELARFEIPLPPLAEQRRIAEVLDRAEALRAKRRAALAQLDSLTQSLFLDLFGDPAINPKGWPKIELGKIVKLMGGYAFKSKDFADEGNAVIRISNLIGGGIDLTNVARIPSDKLCKGANFRIHPGDVLIAMSGATTGKLGVVPLDLGEELYLNQRVGAFRIRDAERAHRDFLLGLLRSSFYQQFLWQLAAGVAQPNVSGWQLESAVIPIPPMILQNEFARRVAVVEKLKTAHRAALAELDALFASLQHRAFRGEL